MEKIEILELLIDDEKLKKGIQAISLVSSPAMESDFITMSKDEMIQLKTIDEEKRILMGAVLIPDKPIYRNMGGKEFYVYFKKPTVYKAMEFYHLHGRQNEATIEHDFSVNGTTVIESWIKDDAEKDKSVIHGFSEPVGTWYVSMKIWDKDIWDEYVKSGKVKGFSIEGYFTQGVALSKDKSIVEQFEELLTQFVDS